MITGVRWFTGLQGCFGIVQIVPDHQKDQYRQTGEADFKYYLGAGYGEDEKEDMNVIADRGAPFDVAAGNVLFRIL